MNTIGIEKHGSKIAELFGGLAFIAKFLRLKSWPLFWQSFHPPFLIGAIQHAKKRPKLHLTRHKYLVIFLPKKLISHHISSYLEILPRCAMMILNSIVIIHNK